MKTRTVALTVLLASWAGVAAAQSCPPASRPSNPAAGSQALRAQIVGDFRLNEERSRSLEADAGKSYWFSAAGCPRMGRIRIAVVNADGKTVQTNEGYSPSLCFIPEGTGKYTFKVTAASLSGSNSWGSIDAGLSDSTCK